MRLNVRNVLVLVAVACLGLASAIAWRWFGIDWVNGAGWLCVGLLFLAASFLPWPA